jgi:hypothetical protein
MEDRSISLRDLIHGTGCSSLRQETFLVSGKAMKTKAADILKAKEK